MEERIPLTSRNVPKIVLDSRAKHLNNAGGATASSTRTLDEGTLDLLEHLIAIVLQGNIYYLQELLQNDEILEVLDLQDNKGFTALHIASDRGDAECIKLLLQAGANPNIIDRFGRTALHWVNNGGCHCEFCNKKRGRCTHFLLEAKANMEIEDFKSETSFLYAIRNNFVESVVAMLEYGVDITRKSNGVRIAEILVRKIPEVVIRLLDGSISYDKNDNSKLNVDFGVLLQLSNIKDSSGSYEEPIYNTSDTKRKRRKLETDLLSCILDSSYPEAKEKLLTHPVTESFLYLKWLYVRKWFWFLRFFYSSLTLVYTYFVFKIYIWDCPYDGKDGESSSMYYEPPKDIDNTTANEDETNPKDSEICSIPLDIFIIGICIVSWLGLVILGELYELCVTFKNYFKKLTNYGIWLLIGCVGVSVLPVFLEMKIMDWQYPVVSVGLFLSWTMNLAHIRRIPYFGVYIEVLGKVLQKLFVSFVTYISLFIAFVLGFTLLFPTSSFFGEIQKSVLRAFLMMLGDRDYDILFNTFQEDRLKNLEYSIPVHIFYVIFLVVFGIAIMNIMIAFAVSDLQELYRNSELSQVVKEIQEISLLESFISSGLISRCLTTCCLGTISILKRNGRFLKFSPTDPEDQSIPTRLKCKFIPYLKTRPCLMKQSMLRPLSQHKPNPLNSRNNVGLSNNLSNQRPPSDQIEDFLNELRQSLLQDSIIHQRRKAPVPFHERNIYSYT